MASRLIRCSLCDDWFTKEAFSKNQLRKWKQGDPPKCKACCGNANHEDQRRASLSAGLGMCSPYMIEGITTALTTVGKLRRELADLRSELKDTREELDDTCCLNEQLVMSENNKMTEIDNLKQQLRAAGPGDDRIERRIRAVRCLLARRSRALLFRGFHRLIAAAVQGESPRQKDKGENSTTSGADAPLAWPPYWSRQLDDDGPRDYEWWRQWRSILVDARRQADEYRAVADQFYESMRGVSIVRINRIQHRLMWRRYAAHRDEVRDKCGGDARELRLWHGTGETDPKEILSSETGLDALRSAGGFYGRGIYLAEHAMYSNGDQERTYFNVGTDGLRQILLVRAACGNPRDFGGDIKRDFEPTTDLVDPTRSRPSLQMRFDSVVGGPHCPSKAGDGPNASRMYVFYTNASIVPEYMVTYASCSTLVGRRGPRPSLAWVAGSRGRPSELASHAGRPGALVEFHFGEAPGVWHPAIVKSAQGNGVVVVEFNPVVEIGVGPRSKLFRTKAVLLTNATDDHWQCTSCNAKFAWPKVPSSCSACGSPRQQASQGSLANLGCDGLRMQVFVAHHPTNRNGIKMRSLPEVAAPCDRDWIKDGETVIVRRMSSGVFAQVLPSSCFRRGGQWYRPVVLGRPDTVAPSSRCRKGWIRATYLRPCYSHAAAVFAQRRRIEQEKDLALRVLGLFRRRAARRVRLRKSRLRRLSSLPPSQRIGLVYLVRRWRATRQRRARLAQEAEEMSRAAQAGHLRRSVRQQVIKGGTPLSAAQTDLLEVFFSSPALSSHQQDMLHALALDSGSTCPTHSAPSLPVRDFLRPGVAGWDWLWG